MLQPHAAAQHDGVRQVLPPPLQGRAALHSGAAAVPRARTPDLLHERSFSRPVRQPGEERSLPALPGGGTETLPLHDEPELELQPPPENGAEMHVWCQDPTSWPHSARDQNNTVAVSAATVGLGCACCRDSNGRPLLRTDVSADTKLVEVDEQKQEIMQNTAWPFGEDFELVLVRAAEGEAAASVPPPGWQERRTDGGSSRL